ncbi:NYN domain-containing protein [Nocardioides panacihumi]|uniref:NYN domain-containing protein n=1 Tax=Nocardioides panacihumi TaxID=400774 RepID=UPI0031D8D9EC
MGTKTKRDALVLIDLDNVQIPPSRRQLRALIGTARSRCNGRELRVVAAGNAQTCAKFADLCRDLGIELMRCSRRPNAADRALVALAGEAVAANPRTKVIVVSADAMFARLKPALVVLPAWQREMVAAALTAAADQIVLVDIRRSAHRAGRRRRR